MRTVLSACFFLSFLSLGLSLGGCDDDDPSCDEADVARCNSDGDAIERCTATGDGLEWVRTACARSTPSCAEEGPTQALCIAEEIAACDEATFEDRCAEEDVVEDCFGGAVSRIRCGPGERCVDVPNARHACVPPRVPNEPPALVTYVTGVARLGEDPAPAVPFQVPVGTPLHLEEDAVAIVLVKERPSRLEGPAQIDVYTLQPEAIVPSAEAQTIIAALSEPAPRAVPPNELLVSPAPSRTGAVRWVLGEGVPGASSELPTLEWRCARSCGRTVVLLEGDQVVWRGQGERTLEYGGPDLVVGREYRLEIGDVGYSLELVAPERLNELLTAMRGWSLVERMSVVAAIHRWSGSRAAAIAALRQARTGNRFVVPEIDALRTVYGDVL